MAMKTATITVDADFAQVWNAAPVAKRKQLQMEIKRKLLNGATVKEKPQHLSRKESELLLRIGAAFPSDQWERVEELTDKMEFESVTDEEQAELLRLSDLLEVDRYERLKAVVELAKYRKMPLDELMAELGMEPGRHAR
jgi:hypothetical protein